MKHLSQNDLVLHYYGESGVGTAKHIAECSECRANYQEFSSVLSAIILPEPSPRGEDYGSEVWSKIKPQLQERGKAKRWWAVPRRWSAVATVAGLIAVAFLAGRYTNRPPTHSPIQATNNGQLPQRVLVVALGDYLDRSEMLLVEVAHAGRPEDLDLDTQRQYAHELVATNRLYRQTALRVGDVGTAALLDQLERVLLQVEHAPQNVTGSDLQQLRQQIESGGLLFKVRVAQVQIRSKSKSASHADTVQDASAFQDQKRIL